MTSEWQLKKEICDVGRRMYESGFVAANDGNISVRVAPNRFLCTPTGVSKGFMTPDMIALVDEAGKQIAGSMPRTSEVLMHLVIFRERPEINAVTHAHPPHATAFAIAGMPVPSGVLPEVEVLLGQVPTAPYNSPGTKEFAEGIVPHLRNKANTILLANHGAVAFDKDLEQAYFHMETLDSYCRILLLSKEVGTIQPLGEAQMRQLLAAKERMGLDDPRIGSGEVCALAGSDEFLRGFSVRPIAQHQAGADGHGRGRGIESLPSQCGQAQEPPSPRAVFPATVAGRFLPGLEGPGASSATARRRAMEDQIEAVVQAVTDQIVGAAR